MIQEMHIWDKRNLLTLVVTLGDTTGVYLYIEGRKIRFRWYVLYRLATGGNCDHAPLKGFRGANRFLIYCVGLCDMTYEYFVT